MTMLLTTCFAFAVLRCIEEFVRFCFNYISGLRSKDKTKSVIVREWKEWKRLSANVSPELHALIKGHAQRLGMTITEYILVAINEKLERINRG